jgi:cyclopropane-fatty-acyl-phospholipid synthase
VGARYLESYFGRISELLCEDGAALIQAITIEDHRYQQALRSVDFIQRYIFPGSFIPSVSAMLASMARVTDLRLFNLEDIGASYALTLRAWRRRFRQRIAEVRQQGFTERFVRMWDFYLAYCEGGFIERATGDVQLLLLKPRSQRAQWVPALPCYQAI